MTSAPKTCCGIYREPPHSPMRVSDDALILEHVRKALENFGFRVTLLAAEEFDGNAARDANIFAMCERDDVLDRLAAAEKDGAVVINSPEAIRNTYRHRLVELFDKYGVVSPASQVVATDASTPPLTGPVWIKRYDFHALRSTDVVYVATPETWQRELAGFAADGTAFAVTQEHVSGDLVKFYGVGSGLPDDGWFEWSYHNKNKIAGHSFDTARLRNIGRHAAAVLGVEIFGGDAVIREDGEPIIIDLNAWPSFARCRDRAAPAIAEYVVKRFAQRRMPGESRSC